MPHPFFLRQTGQQTVKAETDTHCPLVDSRSVMHTHRELEFSHLTHTHTQRVMQFTYLDALLRVSCSNRDCYAKMYRYLIWDKLKHF